MLQSGDGLRFALSCSYLCSFMAPTYSSIDNEVKYVVDRFLTG